VADAVYCAAIAHAGRRVEAGEAHSSRERERYRQRVAPRRTSCQSRAPAPTQSPAVEASQQRRGDPLKLVL
jgi:hypothetical protein